MPPVHGASRFASIWKRVALPGQRPRKLPLTTTRDKKEIHTPSEVLGGASERWQRSLVIRPIRVVQEARQIAQTIWNESPLRQHRSKFKKQSLLPKSRNFEREAVTDERDIMRDALRRGMGDLTYGQVRDNFAQRVKPPASSRRAPGLRSTTPDGSSPPARPLPRSLATIKHMQQGQTNNRANHAPRGCRRPRPLLASFLNPAQQRAIRRGARLPGPDTWAAGVGRFSGKTTTLEASIREGAERNGYAVEGFAPTSRAAAQLRDAGIHSRHLARFSGARRRGAQCGRPERPAPLYAR